MAPSLKRTLLYPWHAEHGARFAEFAGWEMPIQYAGGSIAEHHLVRRSAGLFDIAHMGRFAVSGADSVRYLDRLLSAPMLSLASGESRYALLCREDGGILDDVFAYHLDGTGRLLPGDWMVVVNAGNLQSDLRWMREQADGFDVTVEDWSEPIYMIALQGPRAVELADALSGGMISAVPRFGVFEGELAGVRCIAGRTGYTGEDGVELYFSSDSATETWERILAEGERREIEIGPIGLAARDSLRFEPGFALYGHEINETTNPLEAGLKWACDLGKSFVGRDALADARGKPLEKKIVTIRLTEKGVPRPGFAVYHGGAPERIIGRVVSGMYAPTADGYFANAFVPPEAAASGTELSVEIRGQKKAAVVVKRPIYRPAYR